MGWIPRIGVGGALCVDVRARAVQERHRMLLRSAHISSPTGPLAAPCFFPSVTKASMGFVQRALVIRRCNRLFLPRAPLWTSLGAAPAGSFTSAPPLTSRARHSRSRPHQRAAPDVHQRRSEFLSALFQTTEQAAPHLQRGRLPEGSSTNAGPSLQCVLWATSGTTACSRYGRHCFLEAAFDHQKTSTNSPRVRRHHSGGYRQSGGSWKRSNAAVLCLLPVLLKLDDDVIDWIGTKMIVLELILGHGCKWWKTLLEIWHSRSIPRQSNGIYLVCLKIKISSEEESI
ncbi:uncharacterized protein [Lolium perenne]|uniref:uncharacterized protein isoform X1 n=1 Tax=Lolium perenne TaxID=4522 RepID=UPI003A9A0E4B